MENSERSFLIKNWSIVIAVVGLIFTLGKLYSDNINLTYTVNKLEQAMVAHKIEAKDEHDRIQAKQEAKWGDIPEIEQRVDDLEEWKSFMEGYERLPR